MSDRQGGKPPPKNRGAQRAKLEGGSRKFGEKPFEEKPAGKETSSPSAGKAVSKPSAEKESSSPSAEKAVSKPPVGKRSSKPPVGKRSSKPPVGKRSSKPSSGKASPKTYVGKKGVATDDLVRLNKYIAASGICSRREADELITAGVISVNGEITTVLGTKVKHTDEVRYNGERLRNEGKVYLVLNKPKDYVTTTDDPKERKTVMLLISEACKERIYPVGRLDRNTTGVLLFTNDGELAKKLTHPSYNKKKIYHVFLDKAFSSGDMKKLGQGVELEDGLAQPDAISYASVENKREVGLEIHSGKNRIVRRMFESLGYKVNKLDRVYFAGLTKKDIPRGKWRLLSEKEITRLKMNAYE
jgi:23S rRNA pseudouridine2605 synthase